MPAFVIVQITIEDPVAYEGYKALASASIAQYGGGYLIRGGQSELLEGGWQPARLVVMEFTTVERAREWLTSPEYSAPKSIRHASARTEMLLVEGVLQLT
ncbi:MAG: DUF1330 domain-containing protein [Gemmatimonadota bacterium]